MPNSAVRWETECTQPQRREREAKQRQEQQRAGTTGPHGVSCGRALPRQQEHNAPCSRSNNRLSLR
jgi:hypothetical protein